ncbi:dihydrofolate reductase family protein [Lysinibacillus sp. BW-2-10]|uniref:dihydrofolate reductase family protein n=1 Tax=Lysinibacillus sp. BW-2-10 TaxID=2590030 RepID=UPI00117F339C|nr:dihydrofolate reductase family protein [Lysinibacillus sp. BW-2-10]TSI10748.1 dihydrofolate reductase [Lysinibacillus sp. BW-2-10]
MTNPIKPRRILLDLAVTLDGFIEGENGEIDWCIMDPEMEFMNFLNGIDSILYGRKSYELWGQFTPESFENELDKEMWEVINSKEKYVFSRSQKGTDCNAIFINDRITEEMQKLKAKPGKDMWLYGGASLITTFINLGLVDEYRLSIHPVILGKGKPLFIDIHERVNLKLVNTKTYSSGVVQLIYHSKDN